MRLTLEPTEQHDSNYPAATVSIMVPGDDWTLTDVVEYLIRPVLVGFGYGESTVEKIVVTDVAD